MFHELVLRDLLPTVFQVFILSRTPEVQPYVAEVFNVVSNEADVTDLFVQEDVHWCFLLGLVERDDVEHDFQSSHSSLLVHSRFPPLDRDVL